MLSFVRRSGRLDDRLQRAWDNYAGTYLLDIAAGNLLDVREGVTLDRAFVESAWGNDNPLIVEIGTGQEKTWWQQPQPARRRTSLL